MNTGVSSRRVALNSALQAGADAFGKVGAIVLYAVMAREVGQAAFGDFTSASSLAVLVLVAAFGVDYRVTRLVARSDSEVGESFWSAIVLKLILGAVVAGLVVGVAILGPYDNQVVTCTALLSAGMVVELTMLTPLAVFRGLERFQPVARALVLYRGAIAILGVLLLLAGHSIVAVSAAWLASSLLALVYSSLQLRAQVGRFRARVTPGALRAVGSDSMGLGLAAVFGATLSRVDVIILGLYKDSGSVALYGGAYRLVESTLFLTTALALSSFPAMSRLTRTTSPTIAEVSALAGKVVLFVTVPLAVAFALCAEQITRLVYGGGFTGAARVLELLSPVVVLAGVTSMIAFILTAQQRQWPIVASLGTATVVNVILNLLLVPGHAEKGSALAMIATLVVMTVLLVPALLRAAGALSAPRILAAPGAGGLAMAGTGLALGAGLLAMVPAFGAFVLVAALVERSLYPDDARRIPALLRRKPADS